MKKVIIVFMLMFIISLPQLSFSDTSDLIVKNKTYSRKIEISDKFLNILYSLRESNKDLRVIGNELIEARRIIDNDH